MDCVRIPTRRGREATFPFGSLSHTAFYYANDKYVNTDEKEKKKTGLHHTKPSLPPYLATHVLIYDGEQSARTEPDEGRERV